MCSCCYCTRSSQKEDGGPREQALLGKPAVAPRRLAGSMLLPAPDGAVLGVDYLAEVAEAALGEDPCRGVCFWQCVGADGANVLGEGEVRERFGRLGCKAVALMLGFNAVGDLDDATLRRPFEAALPDGAAGLAMHDGKRVPPRIRGVGSQERGEPFGRNL